MPHGLLLPQNQIDDPATPDMRAVAAAVEEDIGIRAAGFFQRIGEDGESVEGPVGVDGRRDGDDGRREPSGIGDDGTEGVA